MTSSHHVSIDSSWGDSVSVLPCSNDLDNVEEDMSGIFKIVLLWVSLLFSYLNWGYGSGEAGNRWRVALYSLALKVNCHVSIDCAHLAEGGPFRFLTMKLLFCMSTLCSSEVTMQSPHLRIRELALPS